MEGRPCSTAKSSLIYKAMHAWLCASLALIFINLWLESKGGDICTSLSGGVSWFSEKQANEANTLLLIIHVNAEASNCWRTLSLIASVRQRGWTGQIALITDQPQWSFGSAEQDAVYLDPDKTIIRIVDAGGVSYSKSQKYTVFDFFLEYEYFWYIDSDQVMIGDVHHFFKLINEHRLFSGTSSNSFKMLVVEENSGTSDELHGENGEIFHTGTFIVKRGIDTVACFQKLREGMLLGANRDQKLLMALYKQGICRPSMLPRSVITFPSKEQLENLTFGNGSYFVHFTGVRRDLVSRSMYERAWTDFGIPGLYESNKVMCGSTSGSRVKSLDQALDEHLVF